MAITRAVAEWVGNYESARSVGSKFRAKRIAPLVEMFATVHRAKGAVSVVDIGGVEKYWAIAPQEVLDRYDVTITVVNLPHKPRPGDHGRFRFAGADGRNLSAFADNAFDIAHSNSVLQHVGPWEGLTRFANEIRRIAPRYFVQTPNYWFPVEPHCMLPFFHWLPEPTRISLVSRFQLGHWKRAASVGDAVRTVEGHRLVSKKMFRALFFDAEILTERVLGLPKSLVAIRR